MSIQDGQGAYSGLWLFSPDVPVQLGDEVEVTGAVSEYFDKTQISTPATVILSQGNALPVAEVLATADAGAEPWEGVLVQVTGVVTNADAGFGEWALSDGSGDLRVDDAAYDAIDEGLVALGNQLQASGTRLRWQLQGAASRRCGRPPVRLHQRRCVELQRLGLDRRWKL